MSTAGPAGGGYRFGFDIGGTFTDFVLIDTASGRVETYKTLTTPADHSRAVREGWQVLLARVGATGAQVESAIHATTLITNALIERKGARAALVTTEGFSDVLDTQREMRYDIYDLHAPPVEPLVPRPLRWEVRERLNNFGEVVEPLDETTVDAAVEGMRRAGVEAIAVCFLHSYKNPMHERQVGARLAAALPGVSISLSHEIAPEIREYERMSTTVANAYVQPLTDRYVRRLEEDLRAGGFRRRMYLMLSSGGITTGETAARLPIRMVESGPAAGVLAAIFYGEQLDVRDLVAFDMGGTTAKMCLVKGGQPARAHTFEIARVHRFKRGSGLPVRVPAIELIEIGAGGGSIAWIDEMGLLKVGPQSAGADPGPACYGRGGTEPTVTDADLLLGYLNPDYFLGGRMRLDQAAAEAAIGRLADRLGMSLTETAWGVYQIVNENMISATRVHVAERCEDPRRLMLLAFGGAGPVHAHAIARALKMPGYVCPAGAGVTSALGLLTAPAAFDFAQTHVARLSQESLASLDLVFASLEAQGRERLAEAGVPVEAMRFERAVDIRHRGQGHEIVLDLPWPRLADIDLDRDLRPYFYERYEALYGYAHRHLALEVMTCRLRATGPRPRVTLPEAPRRPDRPAPVAKARRRAYMPERGGFVEVPVYDRDALPAGAAISGPAIVEEKDSTAVIGPDAVAWVDGHLNLVVKFATG
ncbi:MAG: hydantoinase/oxoprolinase family protein [Armatimonadota bacterium]|nr:hydantoinase/oxoprolinase family protein [Armatimonadota bacterium]MDR7488513.1 hydantoinase/oxoprolinase family protein [Armatimonadota bacterium]MDR7573796.1 hydantoinase/oxoprolinase family protein [Armatimonadota bacterium]